MTTIQIILLIFFVIYLCNAIRIRNKYINNYLNITGNFGNLLGTTIASCIEGVMWWYIIKTIISTMS